MNHVFRCDHIKFEEAEDNGPRYTVTGSLCGFGGEETVRIVTGSWGFVKQLASPGPLVLDVRLGARKEDA